MYTGHYNKEDKEPITPLPKGIYIFEGLNGAGKTTLINKIASNPDNIHSVDIIKFPTNDVTAEMNSLVKMAREIEECTIPILLQHLKEAVTNVDGEVVDKLVKSRPQAIMYTILPTIANNIQHLIEIYDAMVRVNLTDQDKHLCNIISDYKNDQSVLPAYLLDRSYISTFIYNYSKFNFYSKYYNYLHDIITGVIDCDVESGALSEACEKFLFLFKKDLNTTFSEFYSNIYEVKSAFSIFTVQLEEYPSLKQMIGYKDSINLNIVMLDSNNPYMEEIIKNSSKNEMIDYKIIQDSEESYSNMYKNLYYNLLYILETDYKINYKINVIRVPMWTIDNHDFQRIPLSIVINDMVSLINSRNGGNKNET